MKLTFFKQLEVGHKQSTNIRIHGLDNLIFHDHQSSIIQTGPIKDCYVFLDTRQYLMNPPEKPCEMLNPLIIESKLFDR